MRYANPIPCRYRISELSHLQKAIMTENTPPNLPKDSPGLKTWTDTQVWALPEPSEAHNALAAAAATCQAWPHLHLPIDTQLANVSINNPQTRMDITTCEALTTQGGIEAWGNSTMEIGAVLGVLGTIMAYFLLSFIFALLRGASKLLHQGWAWFQAQHPKA